MAVGCLMVFVEIGPVLAVGTGRKQTTLLILYMHFDNEWE